MKSEKNFEIKKTKLNLTSQPFKPKKYFFDKNYQNSNQIDSIAIKDSLEDNINDKNNEFISKKIEKKEVENEFNLNINAKEYIPNKQKMENKEKEKKEKEQREKMQQEKEQEIKKKYLYSFEYLLQFEKWEISNRTNLLSEETLNHINNMEEKLKKYDKSYKKQKFKNNNSNCNTSISSSSSNNGVCLEQWARKPPCTEEIKLAEENKLKLKEFDERGATKNELREILNIMTHDNYDEKKSKILEIIKENVEYQDQFLEIFFKKAVRENSYAELYAKLSKYLDKELPQRSEEKTKTKKKPSLFREKLINKCRNILKCENFDEYIQEKEPEERKNKLKKLILGNVNFLMTLVKVKILSKKIVSDCIDFSLKRYKEENNNTLKLIFAQAYILFVDKFGALIYKEKMKPEELKEYKEKFEKIFENIKKMDNDNSIPGQIKYLIINLIHKKNNNFEESKYEQALKAKSKKELKDLELKEEKYEENEDENTKEEEEEEINEKISKDLNEYKEFVKEKGVSKEYPWKITTELYDLQFKPLDNILKAYVISSFDFIEKKENIIYAKNYIKELINFYSDKIAQNEKNDLQKKIFNLFELVKDLALDNPTIYDIYSYVLFIFIDDNIMKIADMKNIFNKEMIKEDIEILSKVLQNISKLFKDSEFKKEMRKFDFILTNKGIFKWIFGDN